MIGVVVGGHRVRDVVQESGDRELEVVRRFRPKDRTALEAVREDVERRLVLDRMSARENREAFVDGGDRRGHRPASACCCAS